MPSKDSHAGSKIKRQHLGRGVFAVFKGRQPFAFEIAEVPLWLELVGEKMFTGFVQSFHAAERFDAIHHLFILNNQYTASRTAKVRNGVLLSLLNYSALYEAVSALQTLSGSGIKAKVGKDNDAWAALSSMLKRWEKEPLLKKLRDKAGHHLGDPSDIQRALKTYKSGNRLRIFESDGTGGVTHTSFPMAMDVVLRSLDMEQTDYVAMARIAHQDFPAFGQNLQKLFCDVLRAHGAFPPE